MKKLALILVSMIAASMAFTQKDDYVQNTFSSTRVINNHSSEMIPKGSLEFIVAHKFGDFAGSQGGIDNFFGFDNLQDVRLAFEYGILDNLDIGIGRCKGIGVRNQILDGFAKYKILSQKKEGMPISLTFVSSLAFSYAKATTDSTSVSSYPKFLHRFIFTNQVLVTRKFGDRFSWQINGGYNHRNYVDFADQNGLFFAGTSARFRITKFLAVLAEYNYIFDGNNNKRMDPLHFGFEIQTGGHVFALHWSNSSAMNENLFIPNTTSNWLDGQFRFGFSFNRRFKL